jgi:PhnB protein
MEPTVYLYFNGNCLEAMRHYEKVLGGEITGVFRNGDAPDAQTRMPGGDDLVMNMNMRLGNSNIMASDAPDDWYSKPAGFNIAISPSSIAEFDRIYGELSKDAARISMPPAETFWAERFAMFTDKYGTPWMLMFAGDKMRAS